MLPQPGKYFDNKKFVIIDHIASGSFGHVYSALKGPLKEPCVLKLEPECCDDDSLI